MRAALVLSLLIFLVGCVSTPPVTVSEPLGEIGKQWSMMEDSPQMVAYFKGTFGTMNFTVKETGERFYLVNEEKRIKVMGGRAGNADVDVPITQQEAESVARLGADGKLDEADSQAIMKILFGPVAGAFLSGSFLNNQTIRRLAGVEDLIHITFRTDGGADTSAITLRAEGDHWTVTHGLVGKPKRVFRLQPGDSVDYMRHVYKTRSSNNPGVWIGFVNWYKHWRDRVSYVPATA